jgi:hypothetical protein
MNSKRGQGKRSSYFPDVDSNVETKQFDAPLESAQHSDFQPVLQTRINFPSVNTILWDRTPVGEAVYLESISVVPSVLLVADDVRSILSTLSEHVDAVTIDCRVTVKHRYQLKDTERAVACRPYTGTPYVSVMSMSEKELCDWSKASCGLTIPIQRSDSGRLSPNFDGTSTRYVA